MSESSSPTDDIKLTLDDCPFDSIHMSRSPPTRKRICLSVGSSDRAKDLQDEAHERFITDLQRMVNEDDGCSDVIIICKDGERVKAIRSLLVGRCTMMKQMLGNGMRESSLSEINLPNISSQAFLCVLEFLYTSTILIHQPQTWRMQFELAEAAQYFLLHDLVSIVLELILEKISEVATDLSEVAAMLTMTMEFSHSCQENGCRAIQRELVRLLSSDCAHSLYPSYLSEEALQYLLSNTKAENRYELPDDHDRGIELKQKREPSLTEYYRFRIIILWWASENVPNRRRHAARLVDYALPRIEDTPSLYNFGSDTHEETTGSNSSLRLTSLLKASRDSAMRLLSAIDLRYMPLLVFETVVKPLNLFSSSDITRVFRFHALDPIMRSTKFSNAKCGWKHGTSLTVCGLELEDGSSEFIENTGCDAGTAIALLPLSSRNNIQLWRFVIEAITVSHIEVGFMFISADQVSGWSESDSNKKTLRHLPDHEARVLVILCGRKKPYRRLYFQRDLEKCNQNNLLNININRDSHITVIFQYDFVEHNCSLNVDGQDYGICWENLPDLECYPAVSLGESEGPHSGFIITETPKI